MKNQKCLQVLLWLWFGTITSFVSTNVVNIAKLQTDSELIHQKIENLDKQILLLKYYSTTN
jgi:hypothetical protein